MISVLQRNERILHTVRNDREFRGRVGGLNIPQQRRLGALLITRILYLCSDMRVRQAVEVAQRRHVTEDQLRSAYLAAKAVSIERVTHCSRDADWVCQASHYVASAAAVCVMPAAELSEPRDIAWQAVMNTRMAVICETLAAGEVPGCEDFSWQYLIVQQMIAEEYNRPIELVS